MGNPRDTASELARELQTALDQLSMPPVRRKELEGFYEAASDLAAKLAFFHEQYVLLDLRDSSSTFDDAFQQWAALEPGTIDGATLDRIRTLSQPLGRLHRAGITIQSIKKFSETESRFARLLGDNFATIGRSWDGFKKVINKPAPDFRFQRQHMTPARKFIDAVAELGLFNAVSYEHAHYALGEDGRRTIDWQPMAPEAIPKSIGAKGLLRATLQPTGNSTAKSLVTGEWLNAYAADLVHDHLRRNEMPHEIYTNVVYRAPSEIINVSGDFDVIVQSGDKIAVFECKSGFLDPQRGDLRSTIDKAVGLQRVIEMTSAEVSLSSLLLFNPSATDRKVIDDALHGTGIRSVTPDQVRGVTMELFGTP